MQSKQNGFTLVELMVTAAIMGIISSIALASYLGYSDRTHIKACQSEASGIAKAVVSAIADNTTQLLPIVQISACASTTYIAGTIPTTNFTFTARNSGTPATITCDYQTSVCTSDQ